MKLSLWAKQQGICYRTAWQMFREKQIQGSYQLPTGTIIVPDPEISRTLTPQPSKVAIYARVSSSENRDNLESQAKRLVGYCEAKGYQISKITKEIGSGLNDNRPKLEALLLDAEIGTIVVEHKDRLARFGFNYIQKILERNGRTIEVVNEAENEESDLMSDFVSIITSFTARLYGQRRSKRKTEKIIEELKREEA